MNTSAGSFRRGDRVRIREGFFAGSEGVLIEDHQPPGLVKVMLVVFDRDVPLQVEDWLIETAPV